MKAIFLFPLAACIFCRTAYAQKSNKELQVGAQLSIPVGQLSDLAMLGYGFSAKTLFGFGQAPQ
ncbi:hypothetical protein [Mucilaginibacter sp.]|uniref:hypothetical protein n=1 Tax=Mucilaginibacter sp. TaxID=1882438 RepID=UPI0025DB5542|nr:hypothetical protein [Mucilaginibacter sp.]